MARVAPDFRSQPERLILRAYISRPAKLPVSVGQREIVVVLAGILSAGLLASLPMEAAVGVSGAGLVVGLAVVNPLVAFGALLASVPFLTLLTIEAGDFSVTLTEPLVALLALSWAARAVRRREAWNTTARGQSLVAAFGLVFVAVLCSSLVASRTGLAIKEIAKWAELVFVLGFAASELRTYGHRRAIVLVMLLAASLEAVYGIYQYASGSGPAEFTLGEALRAYGHFEQPNPFAGYLATLLPLGLALLASAPRADRSAGFLGLAVALLSAAIVVSLSRGAWVGVGVAVLCMLGAWSQSSRRAIAPVLACVGLVVLLTAANIIPGAWADRLVAIGENFGVFDVRTVNVTTENFAVVERMAHWQAGWEMFLDHPWLGVGAGNYPARYDDYSLPGWREPLGHAHNYYLNMAAEAGLPGFVALVAALVVLFRTVVRGLIAAAPGSESRVLLVGLLGSFVVFVVHNLFDNLLVHGMAVQIGALAGLAAAISDW